MTVDALQCTQVVGRLSTTARFVLDTPAMSRAAWVGGVSGVESVTAGVKAARAANAGCCCAYMMFIAIDV